MAESNRGNQSALSGLFRLYAMICVLLAVTPAPLYAQSVASDDRPGREAVQHNNAIAQEQIIIVELFSSQACVFCPRADNLFNDLITDKTIIGLTCHVDYFDVNEGALSHRFCTDRQTQYAQQLASGPNYTPQMIINGTRDIVGYKFDKVMAAIKGARDTDTIIRPLSIIQEASIREDPMLESENGSITTLYRVDLPQDLDSRAYDYTMMLYDRPHDITIATGRNRGKKMTYMNIVSALQPLQPENGSLRFNIKHTDNAAGIVTFIQDRKTGAIIAAGVYHYP